MTPTAFVDESEPGDHRDPGTYILGAAVMGDDDPDRTRRLLTAVKPPSARKLHWSESDGGHRWSITRTVLETSASFVVVVGENAPEVPSERRRRLALERLLSELVALEVDEVVLESRGPADKRDRAHLDALRARRALGPVRIDHAPGAAEPLLWLADAVCGAVAAGRRGDGAFLREYGPRVVLHLHRR